MENIKFNFKNIPKEREEKALSDFNKIRMRAREKIDGEYEKNEEETKAINICNDLIQKEIKELGVGPRESLTPDGVHFINQTTADSLKVKEDGLYKILDDVVFINKDKLNNSRIEIYKVILHELVHYYSSSSFIFFGNNKSIDTHHSGYLSVNSFDNTRHEHFRGFDEAVTEKITLEIIKKNREFLINEFNITEEESKKEKLFDVVYVKEIEIINFIIDKLSKFYKKDQEDVWNTFKKGFFSGEMMHLRDIEKVFGSASLRVLAAMSSSYSEKSINKKEKFDNLKKFFEENNQERRNSLAKKILSERERLQYEKTVKNNNIIR